MMHASKKIKILYEINSNMTGGTERFLYNLMKYINKERFEPIAIAYKPSKYLPMFDSLGIRTEVLQSKSHGRMLNRLSKFFKESRINLIQSNYYLFPLAFGAHTARIPHIWRLGGHVDVVWYHSTPQKKRDFLAVIAQLSRVIICPSKFLQEQFRNLDYSKTRVIYNGIDVAGLNGSVSHYNVSYGKISQRKYPLIGMVANFSPQKRHVDFIRAACRVKRVLPNAKFVIFGIFHRTKRKHSYLGYIEQTIKNLGMTDDIMLHGYSDNILASIKELDLMVLPSIDEGASNAILEAMAVGIPVIATSSGGNPELVEHDKTGILVPPKSPERLSEAMLKILKDQKQAFRMGEAGRRQIEKRFDMADCVHRYETMYLSVLGKN